MDINKLIVTMAMTINDQCGGGGHITLSIDGLTNFARSFALDVMHDMSLQNELMKEVE